MIYSYDTYDYTKVADAGLQSPPRGRRRSKDYYQNVMCAFDIETTRIKAIEQSIMYVWQYAIMYPDGAIDVIIGRTWEEYRSHIARMESQVMNDVKIVTYVHNLAYEFQFLKGIYKFEPEQVFAIDRRRPIKASTGKIEYRCSYIHSNMSLDEFTKKYNVEHQKKTGTLDYTKERYPWTLLTDQEMEYNINDVMGVLEALRKEMRLDGDTLYTIPLTSTGYVRRDCKEAMRGWNHWELDAQKVDVELWTVCREAFRGGNTHANRYYANMILDNVHSYDRSSSYPDVILNCKYPMTVFERAENPSPQTLHHYMFVRKRALLARVALSYVSLVNPLWGFPYLTIDKSRNKVNAVNDNGRILSADYLEVTVTDVDLRIIMSEYNCDLRVIDLWHAKYGYLPKPIRDLNIKLYRDKTSLKGVQGQEIYYMKQKNKLNSIYGMMAQNPVKRNIIYENDEWSIDYETTDAEILDKYNRKTVLCYQWGVWVTAWARYRLEEGLRLCGDTAVYCDTDSVKYLGEVEWTEYNAARQADSTASGACAKDKTGVMHYMGVFEEEKPYNRFATLGAKKYAYDQGGKLGVTISGVNKHLGAVELGKLENFKQGFVFRAAGGTESVYNDNPEIKTYVVDGHEIKITSNVVIRDSTYTLGITGEYEDIIKKGRYIMENLRRIY